MTRKNKGNIF